MLSTKGVNNDSQPARVVLFQAYSDFCSHTFAPPPNSPPLSTFLDPAIPRTQEELQTQEKRVKHQVATLSSKSKTSRSIRSISVAALTPVLRGKNQMTDETRDIANSGLAIQMKKSHKRVQSLDTNQAADNGPSLPEPVPGGKLSVIGCISESSFLKIDQVGLRAFGGDIIERPRTPSERKISEETSDQLALWSCEDINDGGKATKENDNTADNDTAIKLKSGKSKQIVRKPLFRLESFRDSESSEEESPDIDLENAKNPRTIMRCHSAPRVKILPATPSTDSPDQWMRKSNLRMVQRFVAEDLMCSAEVYRKHCGVTNKLN